MEFSGQLEQGFSLAFCDGLTDKKFHEGTYRSVPPEQTLARFTPLMAKLGVTRLANITHLDRLGMPVVTAIRPNSKALATSQGKGNSLAAAKASALMESIESWHAENLCMDIRLESEQSMRRQFNLVDVSVLPQKLGNKFDPKRPIQWCESLHLVTKERVWVPAELVSLNLVGSNLNYDYFERSSNGLASGNTSSEAILHALFEVIERDAWALWNLRDIESRRSTQVSNQYLAETSKYFKATNEVLKQQGVRLAVWDMTSDIGIPTFHCMLVEDPESPMWRPVLSSSGSGTHLDPEIALSRALNEAIQCRATVVSGSRDDKFPDDYQQTMTRSHHKEVITTLFANEADCIRPCTGIPTEEFVEQDIITVFNCLKNVGLQDVLVVDLSHEALEVPVVKVIVPGLEGFHEANNQLGYRARRWLQQLESNEAAGF